MKAPIVVTAIALALGAAPLAGAEQAQPRGGGSSHGGGSGGGATARQPSGGGSSGGAHISGGSGGGYDHSSGASRTTAERRHPRPGTGTGHRGHYGGSYPHYWYSPGYYGYYGYYDLWYGPGWYGGYYPGYAYRYRYNSSYDDNGALRLQVNPNKARVYVDGYYAGVVDDFDGLFQRLNLPPGRHELSFKLEGYKTHRVRLYVPPDQTLKVRYDLVRGEGEDTADDSLDQPGLEWAEQQRERTRRDRYSYRDRDRDRDVEREASRERDSEREEDALDAGETQTGAAVLSLEVRPEQAAVYVDGTFRGTGRDLDELNLPPGRHRVEVVAPGFKTFDREVEVKADATEELRVELERP